MKPEEESLQVYELTARILEILPEPFGWCAIPSGEVEIAYGDWDRLAVDNLDTDINYHVSDKKTYQVEAFWMAKYPITVAQFELFVDANGYKTQSYWTDSGWEWKEKQGYSSPRYWDSEKWHVADCPVVCITLEEAQAYAQWLSQTTGLEITLPTEQQWQHAAQGDDNRRYPWGHEFDSTLANTYESGIYKTTPVTQYPTNKSPFGVMDMGGNIWEWVDSKWMADNTHPSNYVVLRGGSFNSERNTTQCTYRKRNHSVSWDYAYGMRIVCMVYDKS